MRNKFLLTFLSLCTIVTFLTAQQSYAAAPPVVVSNIATASGFAEILPFIKGSTYAHLLVGGALYLTHITYDNYKQAYVAGQPAKPATDDTATVLDPVRVTWVELNKSTLPDEKTGLNKVQMQIKQADLNGKATAKTIDGILQTMQAQAAKWRTATAPQSSLPYNTSTGTPPAWVSTVGVYSDSATANAAAVSSDQSDSGGPIWYGSGSWLPANYGSWYYNYTYNGGTYERHFIFPTSSAAVSPTNSVPTQSQFVQANTGANGVITDATMQTEIQSAFDTYYSNNPIDSSTLVLTPDRNQASTAPTGYPSNNVATADQITAADSLNAKIDAAGVAYDKWQSDVAQYGASSSQAVASGQAYQSARSAAAGAAGAYDSAAKSTGSGSVSWGAFTPPQAWLDGLKSKPFVDQDRLSKLGATAVTKQPFAWMEQVQARLADFVGEPTAPSFDVKFKLFGTDYTQTVSLAYFDPVATVLRYIFGLGGVVSAGTVLLRRFV